MIGLCNSLANCSLCFTPILTPLPADFLSKKLKTIEAIPFCYSSYLGFLAILNALLKSLETLSENVLYFKSLESP